MVRRPLYLFSTLARWLGCLAIVVLIGLAAGCRGQADLASDATVSLAVAPMPPATGTATLITVSLADSSGKAITGAKVSVEGNMSHAGMVPVLAETKEVADGLYESQGFRFTMAGDWFITVRVVQADGTAFERVNDVKGVTGQRSHGRGEDSSGGR